MRLGTIQNLQLRADIPHTSTCTTKARYQFSAPTGLGYERQQTVSHSRSKGSVYTQFAAPGAERQAPVDKKALQGERPEVDAAYQACSNYLRSIGIENRAELARILDIATNPNSLFHTYRDDKRDSNPLARKLDVEDDLKPVVDFLLSEGLEAEEVCKTIIAYPAVLCYSPSERMKPFFDYLRSLGIEKPDRTVLQRPSLLGLTADKNLRQMIEYLQQNEYSTEQIEKLLATSL